MRRWLVITRPALVDQARTVAEAFACHRPPEESVDVLVEEQPGLDEFQIVDANEWRARKREVRRRELRGRAA